MRLLMAFLICLSTTTHAQDRGFAQATRAGVNFFWEACGYQHADPYRFEDFVRTRFAKNFPDATVELVPSMNRTWEINHGDAHYQLSATPTTCSVFMPFHDPNSLKDEFENGKHAFEAKRLIDFDNVDVTTHEKTSTFFYMRSGEPQLIILFTSSPRIQADGSRGAASMAITRISQSHKTDARK